MIRAALDHPVLAVYKPLFHTYMSLATPHVGVRFNKTLSLKRFGESLIASSVACESLSSLLMAVVCGLTGKFVGQWKARDNLAYQEIALNDRAQYLQQLSKSTGEPQHQTQSHLSRSLNLAGLCFVCGFRPGWVPTRALRRLVAGAHRCEAGHCHRRPVTAQE